MLPMPLTDKIPPPHVVRATIGGLLRELQIARGMLRLSKLADEQRAMNLSVQLHHNQEINTPSATDAAASR